MAAHLPYRRFTEVLRTWQGLSRSLPAAKTPTLPPWEAARRLIAGAESLDAYARQHLQDALNRSNERLEPLGEPLAVNLGTHRSIAEFVRQAVRNKLRAGNSKPWMRYARFVEPGDPRSSQSMTSWFTG